MKHTGKYSGYGYPYDFSVSCVSPDKKCSINYLCSMHHVEDHLRTLNDYQIDD